MQVNEFFFTKMKGLFWLYKDNGEILFSSNKSYNSNSKGGKALKKLLLGHG